MATKYLERASDFPGSTADHAGNVAPIFVDSDTETVQVYNKTLSAFLPVGQSGAVSKTASFTAELGGTYLLNAAAGLTVTLPTAIGSGARIRIYVGTALTSNSYIFSCGGSDKYYGFVTISDTGASANPTGDTFPATGGSSVTLTLAQATGMGAIGDYLEIVDIGALKWAVNGVVTSTAADPSSPWS